MIVARTAVAWCAALILLAACDDRSRRDGDTAAARAGDVDTSGTHQNVVVYFVELEGARDSVERIGCGDRVVGVKLDQPTTVAPLRLALQSLLDSREQRPEAGRLYNAMHAMSLNIDSIVITDSHAVVGLSGRFSVGGVCDSPRVEAQLTRTAMQFPTVKSVAFFINGKPLRELLSER